MPKNDPSQFIYSRGFHYNIRLPHKKSELAPLRVVYAIKCKVHHKMYIIHMLRECVSRHIALTKRFNKGYSTNMGHHFNSDNRFIQNLVFVPIDTVEKHLSNCEADTQLNKLETYWIKKTCSPTLGNELSTNSHN